MTTVTYYATLLNGKVENYVRAVCFNAIYNRISDYSSIKYVMDKNRLVQEDDLYIYLKALLELNFYFELVEVDKADNKYSFEIPISNDTNTVMKVKFLLNFLRYLSEHDQVYKIQHFINLTKANPKDVGIFGKLILMHYMGAAISLGHACIHHYGLHELISDKKFDELVTDPQRNQTCSSTIPLRTDYTGAISTHYKKLVEKLPSQDLTNLDDLKNIKDYYYQT